MKKSILILVLLIPIALIGMFVPRNNLSPYNEQNYDFKRTTPILSNGIDIADEWFQTEGSYGFDVAYDVAVSSSGYIFTAGCRTNFGDILGAEIYWFNPNGYVLGGQGIIEFNNDIGFYAIEADSAGEIVVGGDYFQAGNGLYYMNVWKYNNTGGILWQRRFGGITDAKCYGLTTDPLNNIYLGGEIVDSDFGTTDMCLVKYNSNGIYQWNRTWGGSLRDICTDVALDSSGNIYMAGNTWSHGSGENDMFLVKINSSGDIEWNKTWGGSSEDYCTCIEVDSNGNIYLAGYTHSFATWPKFYDICLVKFNSFGDYQWHKLWGATSNTNRCYDMEIDSNGYIYLGGDTIDYSSGSRDMCLIKFNGSGVQQWNTTWGGDLTDTCHGLTIDSARNIYLAGKTDSFGIGDFDTCLVKYSSKPKITILSPNNYDCIGSIAPNFTLSIFEPDLSNIWYTIDGGVTNISCSLSGQIDQTEWDQMGETYFPIRFYAKDTGDNEAFAEVYIYKDTVSPTLWIILPESNARFTTNPPIIMLRTVDRYLNSCWYTLDNGLNNHSIDIIDPEDYNDLWDEVNLNVWNALPDGIITITLYVKDAAGNVINESVTIYKGAPEGIIYGYNVFLLFGIFGVLSIYLFNRLRKSLK